MKHRILIPLAGDPASLREVDAVAVGDGRFRIAGGVPSVEPLQFESGEIVECEIRRLPQGSQALVAIRSVSADPEIRKRRTVFAVCGAIVGGIVGALFAVQFDFSTTFAASGFLLGAVAFGFCSVRWGDAAWEILGKIFEPEDY
jgi:hypothetical protein